MPDGPRKQCFSCGRPTIHVQRYQPVGATVRAAHVCTECGTSHWAEGLYCKAEGCGGRRFEVVWVRPGLNSVRRQRRCLKCGWRFVTVEKPT